jgi:DNA replication protein DnaC
MSISSTLYHKYKSNQSILNEEQLKLVQEYEQQQSNPEQGPLNEAERKYAERLKQKPSAENFKVKSGVLYDAFIKKFKELEGVEFDKEYLENIRPIIYYFSKDERFFDCDNVSSLSKPSFEKGLLIVGNYGNGKTSTMKTLRALFAHTPLSFKMYTANRIVTMFEETSSTGDRYAYMQRTKTGRAYFDDVKTEKEASNYGKHNLMKDILEERYNSKLLTHITCNYADGDDTENLIDALQEFAFKYGPRVYDRLFQMFNIIEFKGKSKRK